MSGHCVIHTPEEITRIRRAAEATARVLKSLTGQARSGMSTKELDMLAGSLIAETGGKSAFLGYHGFPGEICISVNDELIHGIGRQDRILQQTDIVSLDIGVELDGAIGDAATTFALGDIPDPVKKLLEGTEQALECGIKAAVAGNFIRDISMAIERKADDFHLGVIRDFVGHGCGIKLHEPPEIPNFVSQFRGPRLVPGMVLAIEPMFTLGTIKVKIDRHDGWTVRTADGCMTAHFEHTILITDNKPEILTWPKTT